MQIETALKKRDRARQQLVDLMSSVRHFGTPHSELLKRRAEILANMGKVPYWVHSYLNGVWDCLTAENYRDHLVFGGMIEGKFYSTHRDRDDYYEKHGISACDYSDDGRVMQRGHYWKNNLRAF